MALATKVGGFDVLCSNIELDNFDEMEKSSKSIAKKLNSVYYDLDNDDTSHLYIVGSVGRKTAIKGSSDLDILFDLPSDTYKKFDAYEFLQLDAEVRCERQENVLQHLYVAFPLLSNQNILGMLLRQL